MFYLFLLWAAPVALAGLIEWQILRGRARRRGWLMPVVIVVSALAALLLMPVWMMVGTAAVADMVSAAIFLLIATVIGAIPVTIVGVVVGLALSRGR